MFGLHLRKKAENSNPRVTIEDLKPIVRAFFIEVRDNAYRQRRDIIDPDWHGTAHSLAVSNFDYCNLLAETRTTRTSVNGPRVDEWIEKELELGRLDRVRAEAAKTALQRRATDGDTFPFSTAHRDRYANQTGRRFEPEDKEQLDDLFLEAAREAWFQVEADRQRINHRLAPDDLLETFPQYQRPFEAASLIKDLGLQREFDSPRSQAGIEA